MSDRLRAIDAPQIKVGGSALLDEEFTQATENDLKRAEMVALPVAFVVMIVIFGGLLAAFLPLIIAVLGSLSAILLLLAATYLTDVSVYTLNVVSMLGLGLGIDYGLLMVSRFREERLAGHEVADAIARTVGTSGTTVVFSALTVAVSLAGLLAFRDLTLRSLAIGGIGVVVLSMTVAITLLPALLGMWDAGSSQPRPVWRSGATSTACRGSCSVAPWSW